MSSGSPRFAAAYRAYFREGYREKGQTLTCATSTIADGIVSNATVATVRYPEVRVQPDASFGAIQARRFHVVRVVVNVTVLTNFAAAVNGGRGLTLTRASAAAGTADPSGGASITAVRHRSDLDAATETLAVGRASTTAALTTTGFTYEGGVIRTLDLSGGGGVAGSRYEANWEFDDPIVLLPGQLLGLRARAFDATGTWMATASFDGYEVP